MWRKDTIFFAYSRHIPLKVCVLNAKDAAISLQYGGNLVGVHAAGRSVEYLLV